MPSFGSREFHGSGQYTSECMIGMYTHHDQYVGRDQPLQQNPTDASRILVPSISLLWSISYSLIIAGVLMGELISVLLDESGLRRY